MGISITRRTYRQGAKLARKTRYASKHHSNSKTPDLTQVLLTLAFHTTQTYVERKLAERGQA